MKNPAYLLFVCPAVLLLPNNLMAQTNWQWANAYGGSLNEAGYASDTDPAGNLYVTGSFTSPSIAFGTFTLNNAGGEDVFIVKYNASGNVLWAKSAGGTGSDRGLGIATDASGNVCLTGFFESPSFTAESATLTNAGNRDVFVMKYDGSGNLLWAHAAGGTETDEGNDIAVDGIGNIVVAGVFNSPTITFGTTNLAASNQDPFLVKYDASGAVVWAKKQDGGGSANDVGLAVAVDASGNVALGGRTSGTITFGSTTIAGSIFGSFFLVKFDAAGNALWAKVADGANVIYNITADNSGNFIASGTFISVATTTIESTTLTNAGLTDMFVAKFNSTGDLQWASSYGGSNHDYTGASGGGYFYGDALDTDSDGNIYLTGYSNSPVIQLGTVNINNGPTGGVFVAQLDPGGNGNWGVLANGTSGQEAYGIAVAADNSVYITGWFNGGSMDFGSINVSGPGANSHVFVAKLQEGGSSVFEKQRTESLPLNVFPNPSNGRVTVVFPSQNSGTVAVYNAGGVLVLQQPVQGPSAGIDLSGAQPGLYQLLFVDQLGNRHRGRMVME